MPSAANRPGNVGEFHIVWRVVTLVIVFIYNDVVCFTIMKKQICISLQKFQKIKKKTINSSENIALNYLC